MKQRRSLTHVGGLVETAGNPDVARLLAEALDVAPAPVPMPVPPGEGGREDPSVAVDDPERAHVHGFHTYPARMHPTTAARLVRALADRPGDVVLDPFCGSGTVLVEAMIAGRRAIGVDLNPLAVRLAQLKTGRRDARFGEALTGAAVAISAFADARRKQRAGATHRYPPEDVEAFDPHVLLELDSLRAGITEYVGETEVREALELVLSSILVKVSRRVADTSTAQAPRRIAAGFTAKLFHRKASELARRLADLSSLVPAGAPGARVLLEDATRLRGVPASSVDAVVTSPPYASTHDYLAHHALRMRWLGLDARGFDAGEMGARRRYARVEPGAAREMWLRELAATFEALSRVCRKGGRVAMLIADSAVGGEAMRADEIVARVGPEAGLTVVARASQRRPHFHGPTVGAFRRSPRAEHAIALSKR